MIPVSPMEVKNVMTSADDATKTIADSFSRHRDDIAKLEANMKGQLTISPSISTETNRHNENLSRIHFHWQLLIFVGQSVDKLISSHIDLLERFGSLVESGMKNGMCEFASMQMLLDRIANLGKYNRCSVSLPFCRIKI